MRLFLNDKKVSLSVREFSEFRLGPSDTDYSKSGLWRVELGQTWHKEMKAQTIAEHSNATFEIPISGTWLQKDWAVSIQGRIDQVIPRGNSIILREIKTINATLPLAEDELLDRFRSYFLQLGTYLVLADSNPSYRDLLIHGELLFIDITEENSQSVMIGTDFKDHFLDQMEILYSFLEQRWLSMQRLRGLDFNLPFSSLRPGQEHTRELLDRAGNQSKMILFEAPTGFGKTGIVLEFALGRLRDGHYDRVIFLTSKSTGQIQVVRQLESMISDNGGLQYFQLRNKTEHAQDCNLRHCDNGYGCRHNLAEQWEKAGIAPMLLFENGSLTLTQIKKLGDSHRVCPYEISRSALPFADVWVADYNYVFNPFNKNIFFEQPGFEPSQTLLIIDEGHNLPSRVADGYSLSYSQSDAEIVINELQFANVSHPLYLAFEKWLHLLDQVKSTDRLDEDTEIQVREYIDVIVKELRQNPINKSLFTNFAFEKLWSCTILKNFLDHVSLEKLIWAPDSGTLNFTCLNAATEIESVIRSFGQTLIMSATLTPKKHFRDSCGIDPELCQWVEAEAEWRKGAYQVAIDLRVETSFKNRSRHYTTTAKTVSLLCQMANDPIIVYFPSYRYAETIGEYLSASPSGIRTAIQPRNLDLAEQDHFIEEAILNMDTLFLVLGSSFSESIDILGGRVTTVMVVGPALPEVNATQRAKMEECNYLSRDEAFLKVYQAPAMVKINQALGRLVRAPGQHARVLLHCRRFAQQSYTNLLAEEYRQGCEIKSEEGLLNWHQGKYSVS
jgi:DNA excision repair protein ERCC-2